MARFETNGIDDLLQDMKAFGELVGETADEMLVAGAEIVKEEWKKSAQWHKHHATGDMIQSIGFSKKVKNAGEVKSVDVYPRGKDRNGKRNAEKAFRLNYGWSEYPGGSHWVEEADANSAKPVEEEYKRIWEKRLREKLGM